MSIAWTHDPISGLGAARTGGRWNRPGQVAMYAAVDLATAVAEYWQEIEGRPGAFVALDIRAEAVIDLRHSEAREAIGLTDGVLRSPWQRMWSVERVEPPTWLICDRARAVGAAGLLVPSARIAGNSNLVLWRDQLAGMRIEVFDPKGEMPKPPANLP